MKKFTAIITAAFMVLTLAACSSGNNSENAGSASGDTSTAEATSSAASDTSTEPEESKPEETKPEETKPEETKPEETKPEETKPEETKPEETKPEETKPAETKPEETKPEETKPAETKPEETKPEETKPEESEPEVSEPEVSEPEVKDEISDPVTLLNSVYALFGDDERFAATGGDFSTGELIEGAGAFGLAEPDILDNVAGFPAAEIASIDSAATLMHMMNQNTFTAGAYHVVEGTDMAALGEAVRANIQSRMWMCGFPDKLIVANAGEYLVCAYGKNAQIDAFSKHLTEAFSSAVIVIEEAIL